MSHAAILTSPHTADRWAVLPESGHALLTTGTDTLDFGADTELAAFVASAPKMARALLAVLNLDLGIEAERALRSEIAASLR